MISALREAGASVLADPITTQNEFEIDLVYLDAFNSEQKGMIQYAASRYEEIIIEDLPDYEFTQDWSGTCGNQTIVIHKGERIDDLRIYVAFPPEGSPYRGSGMPRIVRDNGLPLVGCMTFMEEALRNKRLRLPLHEITHVLGFTKYVWTPKNLLQGFPDDDPHFTGEKAIAAFNTAGGQDYTGAKVPVSKFLSDGRLDGSHWDFSVIADVMGARSGLDNNYETRLSTITLASLADLGYKVDMSLADETLLLKQSNLSAKPVAHADHWCGVGR